MNKTENPQAFPWANDADKQYNWINKGMTLRDYFAAKAMQGYCSDPVWRKNTDQSATALCAYGMADAMLAERDKLPNSPA